MMIAKKTKLIMTLVVAFMYLAACSQGSGGDPSASAGQPDTSGTSAGTESGSDSSSGNGTDTGSSAGTGTTSGTGTGTDASAGTGADTGANTGTGTGTGTGTDTSAGTGTTDTTTSGGGSTTEPASGTGTGTGSGSGTEGETGSGTGTEPPAPVVTWTVSYDGNDPSSGSAPAAQTVIAGESATVAANARNLAKTGFAFSGWNTKSDGTGTAYAAGSAAISPTGNVVLYARWLSTSPIVELAYIQYPLAQDITASTSLPVTIYARTYNSTEKSYEVKLIIGKEEDLSSWIEVAAPENKAAIPGIVNGITDKEYVASITGTELGALAADTYRYTFKIREENSVWFYMTKDHSKAPTATYPALADLGLLTVTK